VLKECVERVPETFSTAQELLQFGLQGTDIDTFISVADGEEKVYTHNVKCFYFSVPFVYPEISV
jgi:hypothetical protein